MVTYRNITRYARCLNAFLLILILLSGATLYADDDCSWLFESRTEAM